MCDTVGTSKCRCGKQKCYTSVEERSTDIYCMVRKLFSDHSWYTVQYIQSAVFDTPITSSIKKRLLENQDEIGFELGAHFTRIGPDNGAAIGKLLTEHIVKADEAVKAAITGSENFQDKVEDFFRQGDHLADVLSSVLELSEDDAEHFKEEFHIHVQHVLNLARLLLEKNYGQKYIAELDVYINHMLHMSDLLVNLAL